MRGHRRLVRLMKASQLSRLYFTVVFSIAFSSVESAVQRPFPPITVMANESGAVAVHTVIAVIGPADTFNTSDYQFLRRLAYVETRDGTSYPSTDDEGGGIWNFNSTKLRRLQQASSGNDSRARDIGAYNTAIEGEFGLSILKMDDESRRKFMRKPLYSAVATRFYLYYLERIEGYNIPPHIGDQADYWVKYFCISNANRHCSVGHFLDLVGQLNQQDSEGLLRTCNNKNVIMCSIRDTWLL